MEEQNEKQAIEEMANDIEKSHWKIVQDFMGCHINREEMAENLYNAGYRKQSVGEWAVTGTERAWNNAEYPIERACSVCGIRRNIETQVGWNFCPKCGAKMKGEEDEG